LTLCRGKPQHNLSNAKHQHRRLNKPKHQHRRLNKAKHQHRRREPGANFLETFLAFLVLNLLRRKTTKTKKVSLNLNLGTLSRQMNSPPLRPNRFNSPIIGRKHQN
jgi:hypothetical protein